MWTFIRYVCTDSRDNSSAALLLFDGLLAEKEQHVSVVLNGAHERRLIELAQLVAVSALRFPVDQRIRTGEIGLKYFRKCIHVLIHVFILHSLTTVAEYS